MEGLVDSTPVLERPTVVGVDGVDGSGKTTFADRLAAQYAAAERTAHVVHLDDFHNPRTIRYRAGRDSPEGYFFDTYNLRAFMTNVIEPIHGHPPRLIVSQAFDHRVDRPVQEQPTEVRAGEVVIVEGMFLHRDELRSVWDLSVFLDVPFGISVARMAERDGTSSDPEDPSLRRYVEGQRIYLSTCHPAERSTFLIDNSRPGSLAGVGPKSLRRTGTWLG